MGQLILLVFATVIATLIANWLIGAWKEKKIQYFFQEVMERLRK